MRLKSIIDRYKYVSFDIFDTLIKRDVEKNSDVFLMVSDKYKEDTGIEVKNFKYLRKNAEKQARKEAHGREVTIQEIYDHIPDSEITVIQRAELMRLEIEIEKIVCTVNQRIKKVFDYCIRSGKKVLIISDMYLPQDTIEYILSKNGYERYDRLYLSNTVRKRKRNVELFEYVLRDQNISAEALLHLGDSIKGDIVPAKKASIRCIKIGGKKRWGEKRAHITIGDDYQDRTIRTFADNHKDLSKSQYYLFGYEKFGRLLLGFSRWLMKDIGEKKIDNVFFLSRDGYILKKAFDLINTIGTKTHYIYVSRRSLRLPYLSRNLNLENAIDSFPRKRNLMVSEFFENLGLDVDNYTGLLNELGISANDSLKRNELKSNSDIIYIFNCIRNDILENANNERTLMLEYFKQEGVTGKIAVVDIGWRGSLQFYIQKIFDDEEIMLNTTGYYIGLDPDARDYCEMNGYLNSAKGEIVEDLSCYLGVMEDIFVSQEGSTKCYQKDANGIVNPVLYEYEFVKDKENDFDQGESVYEIQQGGLAFVEDVMKTKMSDLINIDVIDAFVDLNLVGNHPEKADIELFEKFIFYDVKKQPLIQVREKSQYILKPRLLKDDLRESKWKIGFMKRLIGLPLPYYRIQKIIRNTLL